MRIRISHKTAYRYAAPVKSAIQLLRMTPRNHLGQFVVNWSVDTDCDARLIRREDWFGNITHSLFVDGPIEEIVLTVTGEVETEDNAGVVRQSVERFPPELFLRETRLTRAEGDVLELAAEMAVTGENELARAHALMAAIGERMRFDTEATSVVTSAAEALGAGHGVCQDFSHVFIAVARSIGIPARYVSGYLHKPNERDQEATHAWAEAHIPDLGWVAFDATNGICATDEHVRIATGLDYLDAAPVRGSFYGIAEESLDVRLRVDGMRQSQA